MKNKGFGSMYLIYSFFLVFVIVMLSVLMINNYKKHFLDVLKNDIKAELQNYKLEIIPTFEAENP